MPAGTGVDLPTMSKAEIQSMNEAEIRAVLETVMDPEIPAISVVDLGIVRSVRDGKVQITPTYSGCPATLVIEQSIRQALDAAGYCEIAIETQIFPPWTTDWISEEGKARLKAYGIAPPDLAKAATCPQCGSTDTEEISRFGSTPCKAQWRCKSCLEPFDRFKCH
jgi:ring-1,2-phenylacetyl-CoA epoxidase subunit PaaD